MKLHVNRPSQGITWVKLGVKTFFRQPLAMSGLFFMFMATVSLLSLIPALGTAISVALVPAATLGLMAATREAQQGRFPMPSTMVLAFRGGAERRRAMLMLGALYAAALLMVLGASMLFAADAPPPVSDGSEVTPEMVRDAVNQPGLWIAMLLYLPVLMAFWHAPALVFWHGVKPVKSLFFSFIACWGNKGAMFLFTVGWAGVFIGIGLLLGLLGAVLGGAQTLSIILYPVVLFMASMFHTSLWFTFADSFAFDDTGWSTSQPSIEGTP